MPPTVPEDQPDSIRIGEDGRIRQGVAAGEEVGRLAGLDRSAITM